MSIVRSSGPSLPSFVIIIKRGTCVSCIRFMSRRRLREEALIKEVFGSDSDGDGDGDGDGEGNWKEAVDEKENERRSADERKTAVGCCREEPYGPPPARFTLPRGSGAGRWAREAPHDGAVSGLLMARGALSPEAQAWIMDAIRADDLIDFPSGSQENTRHDGDADEDENDNEEENEQAEFEDAEQPPRRESRRTRGRRNQVMRFGDLPPWARVLAAEVAALARGGGDGGVCTGTDTCVRTGEVEDGAAQGNGRGRGRRASSPSAPLFPPEVLSRGSARMFNQMIVNAYEPGEGLAPHVDLAAFADGVVVVSLEASIVMDLYPPEKTKTSRKSKKPKVTEKEDGEDREGEEDRGGTPRPLPLWLHPGDVLFLSGPARWEWRHGIASRAWDWSDGQRKECGMAASTPDRGGGGGEGDSVRVKVARRHRTSVTLRAMRDDVHELKVSA